ncbi:flavodoxin family protein, partial [Planctomycetota bacterium]
LIQQVLNELESEGVETELVELSEKKIHGCRACFQCMGNRNGQCAEEDDDANECIQKLASADGVILGSPTYFADVTTEMKALIDRAGFVAKANDDMLKRKPGAAVVAVRRAGSIHVFDSINHFFLISQMIIPGSSYWNMGIGLNPGDVEKDDEGMGTMKTLGQNMAWLLKRLKD